MLLDVFALVFCIPFSRFLLVPSPPFCTETRFAEFKMLAFLWKGKAGWEVLAMSDGMVEEAVQTAHASEFGELGL